jgi:SNF2 family DNA or RNA helicase
MGLGKTMQALAFLVWIRENVKHADDRRRELTGPILIVAPTALLRNWQKEAEAHLRPGVLGECAEVFGRGLARLKRPGPPEDALDVETLRQADWVLTTYETLANYHRAFARVGFSVAVFDEMQKIKAPDTINTHAAKTINADFVLGMTGTPIENRIEDLWCIMDRVAPGFLGGLKAFSKTYGDNDEPALAELKRKLEAKVDDAPPLMLRRMKGDHLRGLPERQFRTYDEPGMPPAQTKAYEAIVQAASGAAGRKVDMLRTVHALRGVSLHPHGAAGLDPYDATSAAEWIAQSARLKQVVAVLQEIRGKKEKALVFIEDRAIQAAFATIAAAQLGLTHEPEIINGETGADERQAIVDRFQSRPPGFDLLVLSPKAAGIGLTITAANHVIHLSRWWNPAVDDQCNDRVFRIGQEKPVTVHIPMAVHPRYGEGSFDVKLGALLERKRSLSRDMLAPPVSDSDASDLFGQTVGASSKA